MKEKAILVVSFGTGYSEIRELTIGAIERAIDKAFPEYEVFRAFTSKLVIDKLKRRDGLVVDSVREAMEKLVQKGFCEVVVQSAHVMPGEEYEDMLSQVKPFEGRFHSIKYGEPLLGGEGDYVRLMDILKKSVQGYVDERTAAIFIGHGTAHRANLAYSKLGEMFRCTGDNRYLVGTVEAEPGVESCLQMVQRLSVEKVVLQPLMIVAGDHANEDMAGDHKDSWKSLFTEQGYQVECILRGLGECSRIQNMFVDHVRDALGK